MKTGDLILGAVVLVGVYCAYKQWLAPSANGLPSDGIVLDPLGTGNNNPADSHWYDFLP